MKIVQGVTYRHVAGYLQIVGRTQKSAERHTKSIGTFLLNNLPKGAEIKPGRYRGMQSDGLHLYEVPVVLNRRGIRSVLARLALRGGP